MRKLPTGKHARGKPRPHVWVTGPDPLLHEMYHPWQVAKAQAKYRGEEWNLTFEEYADMWRPQWHLRGRGSDQYCMTRYDEEKPWDKTNAYIILRLEQQRLHVKRNVAAGRVRGYKTK